jgi:hypothetical protein
MYFTDRGIEELEDRRGEEEVTLAWLAERLRGFVDLNPDFEVPVDRLASWLARLDDEEDLLSRTYGGASPRPVAPSPSRVACYWCDQRCGGSGLRGGSCAPWGLVSACGRDMS